MCRNCATEKTDVLDQAVDSFSDWLQQLPTNGQVRYKVVKEAPAPAAATDAKAALFSFLREKKR